MVLSDSIDWYYWCWSNADYIYIRIRIHTGKGIGIVPDEEDRNCWCRLCKQCNVGWGVGKGWKPKGGSVVTRLETWVDENLSPRARSWPSQAKNKPCMEYTVIMHLILGSILEVAKQVYVYLYIVGASSLVCTMGLARTLSKAVLKLLCPICSNFFLGDVNSL